MVFVDANGNDDWIHAEILGDDSVRSTRSGRRSDPPPVFPDIDWVFRCDTVLGQVAPGARDTHYNGTPVPYRPGPNLRTGARWCSREWLARDDTGRRGPPLRHQGSVSRFGMWIRGTVSFGTVIVVPDGQVDTAARVAAELITHPPLESDQVPTEWSMALIRTDGRTRMAVGFGRLPDEARDRLRRELDIEWFIGFSSTPVGDGPHPDDERLEITSPDGRHEHPRGGRIHLDTEAIPRRLVEIAARHGDGLTTRITSGSSEVLLIHYDSLRPLEPDEVGTDRDLSEWTSASI